MNKYSRNLFWDAYYTYFGKYNQQQIEGIQFLLSKLEKSERIDSLNKHAYVLATIKWETANTFQPIREYGSQIYLTSKPYYPFVGRGYSQITWKENYAKFGNALGIDLIGNPDLALESEISWEILEMGLTDVYGVQKNINDPDFTNHTLSEYFNSEENDFINARNIINPGDKRSFVPISKIALDFTYCLRSAVDIQIESRGIDEIH